MNKFFILISLVFASLFTIACEKKSQYSVKDGIASILPLNAGAESVNVVPWTVGILGKKKVAKGIGVKISFPILEHDDILDLIENRSINSWLVRVRRRYLGRTEVLGYLYVPLALPGSKDSSVRIKQTKGGFFSIYYSAAAISSRFEKFDCPAFDHNLWIDEAVIFNEKSPDSMISTSPSEMEVISAKIEAFSYSPITLNGGSSLGGEYIIDLALFNYSTKRKYSNFLELDQKVRVAKEIPVSIDGCAGFQIPRKEEEEEEEDKKFKFGR